MYCGYNPGMSPVAPVSTPADGSLPPQGCTHFKLRQLTRRVASRYDVELGKVGLKATQYSLLSHVVRLGPVRAVDLAAAMKMSSSTLSRNLQPLVAAGWLQLGPGDDARSHRISATRAGQAKRSQAQRRWRAAQDGINQALGASQVRALHALIDQALALLDPVEAELA